MIERFYNHEALGENQDYKVLRHTLNEITDQLMSKLDLEQKSLLSAMSDIYTKLESCASLVAYKDGFCTAALLALDIAKAKDG